MRTLLAAALLCAAATPGLAQVGVRVLPNAGYDIGYDGATVGLGIEVGWRPPGSPVRVALRPSADLVLDHDLVLAVPYAGGGAGDLVGTNGVVRLGGEVVGLWERAPLPVTPYAKAGVVAELERITSGDVQVDRWETGPVVGLGLAARRVFVEATHGFGDASRRRVVVGLRL